MKNNSPQISIIIPVLNEAATIAKLLQYLKVNINRSDNIREVIVVDGGSIDETVVIAKSYKATLVSSEQGRAKQMNTGAKKATGDILYFLHVDTFPPKCFDKYIINAFKQKQLVGCFRMNFDSSSLFLKFFAWFSRFNYAVCRGGDQSLYISKKLFNKLNGFNEEYTIYEDNEFIGRIYKNEKFTVLPQKVKTSARRYHDIGKYKLQFYFGIIHLKKLFGVHPNKLYDYYQRKIAN